MSFFSKARMGIRFLIQVVGGLLWGGFGLLMLVWALHILCLNFGLWAIFVGLLLAPITYVTSIFIIWFSTGDFPLIALAPYIASFVGLALVVVGGVRRSAGSFQG